jgi:Tfp pilus assembly protein PilF
MHTNLAIVCAAKQDFKQAYENMELAIKHFDSDAQASALAADFALRMNDISNAKLHFRRALVLRPIWPEVQSDLARLDEKTADKVKPR